MDTNVNLYEEISRTVVYEVLIISCNQGAWYRDYLKKKYKCVLEIVDKPFSGTEIMFRVLGSYHPVRYIKQQHCIVKSQHIASHKEIVGHYGKQ